jgi:hypothetical protein
VPVLGEAITAEIPFSLTFTGRADISPQVRAFAEHFAAMFNRNHGPESLDANDDSSAWYSSRFRAKWRPDRVKKTHHIKGSKARF